MSHSHAYTHGHHESVLRSHRWRTAENSAAYLLPHLRSGLSVLDLGCGPGTLTCDLAERVAPAPVVGIDVSDKVIEEARRTAGERGVENVAFEVADLYAAEGRYDVVHAHQVLHHVDDPVGALRTMARLASPGGLVAVRECDYPSTIIAPGAPTLARWLELFLEVMDRNHANPSAGRTLPSWARQAELSDWSYTTTTWTYIGDDAEWWGDMWSHRSLASDFATQAVDHELATDDELAGIAEGWRAWSTDPDATFVMMHGELLARV